MASGEVIKHIKKNTILVIIKLYRRYHSRYKLPIIIYILLYVVSYFLRSYLKKDSLIPKTYVPFQKKEKGIITERSLSYI